MADKCPACGCEKCTCADVLKPFMPQQDPKDRELPKPKLVPKKEKKK